MSLAAIGTLLAVQRQARDVETALLAAAFAAFTVFLALSLLDAASPPAQRLTFFSSRTLPSTSL